MPVGRGVILKNSPENKEEGSNNPDHRQARCQVAQSLPKQTPHTHPARCTDLAARPPHLGQTLSIATPAPPITRGRFYVTHACLVKHPHWRGGTWGSSIARSGRQHGMSTIAHQLHQAASATTLLV